MPTRWKLRCTECGRIWYLEVSFDLTKLATRRLYHYCPYCRRNTFHEILGREDDGQQGESSPQPSRGSEDRRIITDPG